MKQSSLEATGKTQQFQRERPIELTAGAGKAGPHRQASLDPHPDGATLTVEPHPEDLVQCPSGTSLTGATPRCRRKDRGEDGRSRNPEADGVAGGPTAGIRIDQ